MTPFQAPPETEPERPIRAGFSVPLDIVIAPARAIATIGRTGQWAPALVVIVLLGVATTVLAIPAVTQIASRTSAPPPFYAVAVFVGEQALLVPIFVAMLAAMTLALIVRFKHPQAPIGRFVALTLNGTVISSLGSFIHVAVAALRAPAAYHDATSFTLALPDSLAIFASRQNADEVNFLGHFSLFDAWAFIVIAFGFSAFAGMRFTTALVIALVLDVASEWMFG